MLRTFSETEMGQALQAETNPIRDWKQLSKVNTQSGSLDYNDTKSTEWELMDADSYY